MVKEPRARTKAIPFLFLVREAVLSSYFALAYYVKENRLNPPT